ncbi:hypothetical protein ES702_04950 [subsurface metagenome]
MKKKEDSSTGSEDKKIPGLDPEITEEKKAEPKKKKMGRPRKEPPPEPPAQYSIIDKELCKEFAGIIPFLLLSITTGNNDYKLTDEEKENLAPHWDRVFNKYLPGFAGEYKEEMVLATAIGTLIIVKSGFFDKMTGKKEEETEKHNIEYAEGIKVE